MKYFIYARKSTEDDDKQILSIQAQLAELQEYSAKEKLVVRQAHHPECSRRKIVSGAAHFDSLRFHSGQVAMGSD